MFAEVLAMPQIRDVRSVFILQILAHPIFLTHVEAFQYIFPISF